MDDPIEAFINKLDEDNPEAQQIVLDTLSEIEPGDPVFLAIRNVMFGENQNEDIYRIGSLIYDTIMEGLQDKEDQIVDYLIKKREEV